MIRKSALKVMVTEGMSMVPNILHLSSTAGTTIMSTFSSYASVAHCVLRRIEQSINLAIAIECLRADANLWRPPDMANP